VGVKRGEAPLFNFLPLWKRGIKGDLKSLSISLYKREKASLQRSSRGRGTQVEDSSRG